MLKGVQNVLNKEKKGEKTYANLKMCVGIIVFMLDWILLAMQWPVVD